MFFRLQQPGLTLEQMQEHNSLHGEDLMNGICASDDAYSTNFGGSCDEEVVVIEADVVERIYDGVVVHPTKIVARYTYEEWCDMIDSGETR
ncbi:MAG: hypothetical protein M9918_13260 [Anaerolineae bacterium]|nr:hypothetical protein [Anaerolineae bacterium]